RLLVLVLDKVLEQLLVAQIICLGIGDQSLEIRQEGRELHGRHGVVSSRTETSDMSSSLSGRLRRKILFISRRLPEIMTPGWAEANYRLEPDVVKSCRNICG